VTLIRPVFAPLSAILPTDGIPAHAVVAQTSAFRSSRIFIRAKVRRIPLPLAVIQNGRTELISRNGNSFKSFEALRKELKSPYQGKTVLDGEIVCLDRRGRPQFRDLLFHRGEPCFFAFDLLMADGKDLRSERLTDRKQELRRLMLKVPESRCVM
jgi:hypothetical protein